MTTSTRQTTSIALVVLACAAACGKKAASSSTGAPPWQVDAAQVQARLQGTWTVKDGDRTATWHVDKDHVVIDDAPDRQISGKLVVESPCSLAIHADTGMTTAYLHYLLDGETPHLGAGRAGVRQGNAIVVCAPFRIYVRTGNGCAAYEHGADDSWVKRVATCAMYSKGNEETFDGHTDESFDLDRLTSEGTWFADDQMRAAVAQRAASAPAAKP